jgi:flagellum-specific ATP synthase
LYEHNRDLISIGAYQRGSDPRVDEAIASWPQIEAYLRQDMRESVRLADSISQLQQAVPETAVARSNSP